MYLRSLYREVNGKIRYYTLRIELTLFGEYLLIREFGSIKNKKPTRIIKEYYSNLEESISVFNILVIQKLKKGYSTLTF
jgi:predicted DNA-binding WGR domain protein